MEQMSITTGAADTTPTTALTIPRDFLSLKLLYSPADIMVHKDPSHFFRIPQGGCGGHPTVYTRIGASFLIKPTLAEGDQIVMLYYAAQPVLVADEDINFFGLTAPDLIIYGALSYACDYFVDDRTGAFEQRFKQLYDDLDEQGRMTDMEQSAQAIAPAHNTEY
jgi:hypothetical protein